MKIRCTKILSLLILLTFLGFLGLENYLILLAFFMVLFLATRKSDFNNSVILLFAILSLHVCIYYYNYSNFSIDWLAKNLLNPVILCFLGYWLALRSQASITSIRILICGFFIHGALNILIYTLNPSTMVDRSMINIWGGQITATLQNLLFIPVISLLFYGLFILKNKRKKIMIIAACIISVYGSIVSASRTLLYLLLISFFINMLFNIRKNQYRRTNILFSICGLLVILFAGYEFNIFGIRTWVEASSLGERIETGISTNDSFMENIRWTMSMKILSELPSHPLGDIRVVHYAHNLFLDIAKYTGIIPALGVLFWSLSEVKKQFSYMQSCYSDEWDAIMFSMTIGFMIAFLLEPILDGLPIIFGAFCYLCGAMKGRRVRTYEDEV